ncbi:RAMP superfamily CRISPR-associated protein [Streptomyces sp. AC04842]|jgi:CRISPR/Cas system CSM-associated protein Csm3 (group 7 of RAMP superfamily)|uniref:RAMP superfamily CRISPR-associated protein n=2 Tax=unclassified Streptomyces TaxID=2593676 RepID=UPI00307C80CC
MRVTMVFHGPFRVATGVPRPGIDAAVDRSELLPASSLKGLMRDSAERLLPGLPDLVEQVFGGPRKPTVWAWSSARFPHEPQVRTRARVSLDAETGAAKRDHLLYGEEVWARSAEFDVTRHALLPQSPLGEDDHLAVLACAAAGVHGIGSDRRRGLGWVECTTADPVVDAALVDRFRALAANWRQQHAS